MKKLLVILVLVFTALGVTVFVLKTRYPQKLQKLVLPAIEQVNDVNIKAENDTAYVHSKMTAYNQSFFSLKIDSIRYQISLFNKVYMKDETYLGIDLAPGSKDTIAVKFKVPYQLLINDLRKERGKKEDSASYKLDVSLIYSTIIGKVKLPVNREARFLIPHAPEIKLVDIKYKKLGLKNIVADAAVKVINHGDLNLHISEFSYEMKVKDHGSANGNVKETINIKPRGETEINIPIKIELKNAVKIIVDVVKNRDKYNYDLKMDAVVGSSNLKKLEPFHLKLSKSGVMELKK